MAEIAVLLLQGTGLCGEYRQLACQLVTVRTQMPLKIYTTKVGRMTKMMMMMTTELEKVVLTRS